MGYLNRTRKAPLAPLFVLIAPTFVLLGIFSLAPFLWAFAMSFYEYEVGAPAQFVGLANYIEYFSDPTLAVSFKNLLLLTLFGIVMTLIFPLAVAKLIFSLRSERARHFYRVMFLLPVVVPGIAGLMIWQGLVYGDTGIVNEFLRLIGRPHLATGWLGNANTALLAVAFIGFPFAGGINVLIYYAGLSAIPESVHEASGLDGAIGWRKFFAIDVPLVMSQVKLLVILVVIGSVQGFEGMFVLTRGGPGFETMVPGLWMYFNAFSFQRMGYACAIGVILFLIILGLTILNMRYIRSAEELQEARS